MQPPPTIGAKRHYGYRSSVRLSVVRPLTPISRATMSLYFVEGCTAYMKNDAIADLAQEESDQIYANSDSIDVLYTAEVTFSSAVHGKHWRLRHECVVTCIHSCTSSVPLLPLCVLLGTT